MRECNSKIIIRSNLIELIIKSYSLTTKTSKVVKTINILPTKVIKYISTRQTIKIRKCAYHSRLPTGVSSCKLSCTFCSNSQRITKVRTKNHYHNQAHTEQLRFSRKKPHQYQLFTRLRTAVHRLISARGGLYLLGKGENIQIVFQ